MTSLSLEILRHFETINRLQLDLEASITNLTNVTELSEQQEVSSLIRVGVKDLGKLIEGMKQLAEEQDRDKDRQAILQRLRRNEDQYKQLERVFVNSLYTTNRLQASLRRAILTSKQNIEREAKLQLFALGEGRKGEAYEMRRRNLSSDDSVLRATDDVTKTLQRTVQLMQQEIERSAYSAKSLEDSSRILKSTYNEFRGFTAVVRGSKQLITKLEQSDWTDRLLILFGLFVFILVVLYILKRRVLDVGIGWVTWITSWII
ncbi:4936_t:CDS:2 [Ambispora gerdemannii]|uniref:4936_t:CDS:1 n=1 Tax=Ambispora gerdemannii TaxID=144530 RepID=A0A9N9AJE0_9GLOM|nr:4936_t:CDS:2 [Ambispora gerdemannii]